MLVEKSPIYLLSGLGAAAAILLLLLQHTIHSFVASVEINADHLVEIGDWIVMESETFGGILDRQEIDGIVTEISLHTVKVRNWDRTLVCLPICNVFATLCFYLNCSFCWECPSCTLFLPTLLILNILA